MKSSVVVGTRGSRLALVQTNMVVAKLKAKFPHIEFDVTKIVTSGDRDHHTPLESIGINVFVKELEEALLDGSIDMAVHSLKDVPTELPPGLCLVGVIERADPRDVLVGKAKLADLPPGAKIGTSSLRRAVQLNHCRPDLQPSAIRGNVGTRLRKTASGELDGVITAAAALDRLDWRDRITEHLPLDKFLPAAGQGALAIEGRQSDIELKTLIVAINHQPTWQSVLAERSFLRVLGGGCRAPIAALATVDGNTLKLEGMVAGENKVLRDIISGNTDEAEKLGAQLAQKMLGMGAAEFIAGLRGK